MQRRQFLEGSAALGGLSLLGAKPSFSMTQRSIGAKTLISLSDGNLHLPGEFVFGPMPKDALAPILQAYQIDSELIKPDCNITLLRDGERTVLFDVGAGLEFQDNVGLLSDALYDLNIDPSEITHVIFTHAHPDHIWGLLDDFGDPLFSNAQFMMGQVEWHYWMDPQTVNLIGEARQAFAVGAKRRMELIADQTMLFNDGDEVLPGIIAHSTFGHTPGHMSFEIRDGTQAIMVLGDCIGNHHVAFERPQWQSGADQDQMTAAQTRVKLLDKITTERIDVLGFHFPNGGIGHVEKHAQGYKFIQI